MRRLEQIESSGIRRSVRIEKSGTGIFPEPDLSSSKIEFALHQNLSLAGVRNQILESVAKLKNKRYQKPISQDHQSKT
jgi:hypothetical protein